VCVRSCLAVGGGSCPRPWQRAPRPPNVRTSGLGQSPRTWQRAATPEHGNQRPPGDPPNMETPGPRTWKLGGITSRPAGRSALLGHPIAAILANTAPDRGNGGRPWKRYESPDHEKICRHRGGSRLAPTDEISHTTNCPGGPRLRKNTLNTDKNILGLTHRVPIVCLGDHAGDDSPGSTGDTKRRGDER